MPIETKRPVDAGVWRGFTKAARGLRKGQPWLVELLDSVRYGSMIIVCVHSNSMFIDMCHLWSPNVSMFPRESNLWDPLEVKKVSAQISSSMWCIGIYESQQQRNDYKSAPSIRCEAILASYEDAIDDSCELEEETRGPALKDRPAGEAAVYTRVLDRDMLCWRRMTCQVQELNASRAFSGLTLWKVQLNKGWPDSRAGSRGFWAAGWTS